MKIFIDLDGVLADFHRGVLEQYGINLKEISYSEKELSSALKKKKAMMWAHIRKNPEFWLNLPEMFDAQLLWQKFAVYDPVILTAAPRTFREGSPEFNIVGEMKHEWAKTHLSSGVKLVCTTVSKKHHFIETGFHNVLFDDNTANIANWRNAGGIGILHKNSDKSIKEFDIEMLKLEAQKNRFSI